MNIPQIIFSWILISLCASMYLFAEEDQLNEQQMADQMEIILKENHRNIIKYAGSPREEVAPGMENFSDKDRIQMMASYLFLKTGDHPFGHQDITMLINSFPKTIEDDTELRKMLFKETDPRRFYLLRASLAGRFSVYHGSTFISEMAHMLLRDDPVARPRGEYDSPLFHDVSKGTYIDILAYLKRLSAPFEEPPEDIPHEQRKLILARWLKANWPGCENLEISNKAGSKSGGLRSEFPAPAVAASGLGEDGQEDRSGRTPSSWVWGSALLVLAASVGAWLRTRLAKA